MISGAIGQIHLLNMTVWQWTPNYFFGNMSLESRNWKKIGIPLKKYGGRIFLEVTKP